MRIIARKRLEKWAHRYPDACSSLESWSMIVGKATWANLMDVRRDFPHADSVRVASGRIVTIFNIRGNNYRLICAIHYNTQLVYAMRFYTHDDYDSAGWEETL